MARSYTSINLPAHWNLETRNPRYDSVAWFEGRRRKSRTVTEQERQLIKDFGLKVVDPGKARLFHDPH